MRILADSQITNADITATNILSAALTDKLQTYQLADNMRAVSNYTDIDLTFTGTPPDINTIGLCGTNLTSNATIIISYSDTNIEIPEASVTLSTFSTLNQVLFLPAVLSKKYWRISISDCDCTTLFIGYIYIGEYFQVPEVEFSPNTSLDMFSNSSVTPTGQGYGSKTYNALQLDFVMFMEYDDLVIYMTIKQEKQNIDPVLLIEYEDSYDLTLYRPKYGILSADSIPYPMVDTPLYYQISDRLEERF